MKIKKNMNQTPARKKAFTLVELLLVISIIVILVSVMVAASGPIMAIVYRTSCQSQLKALAQVYLSYTNQYSIQFPSLTGVETSKGTPPAGGGASGFDNLIYSSAANILDGKPNGYRVGFGPLSWQQLVAASYYVCPAISDRDQWWHDGQSGDDYWNSPSNSNPDTCIQNNFANGGAPTGGTQIIASYSIRPGLYGWTPSQITMPHGSSNMPAFRAFMADSFYVDGDQTSVKNRHGDGINVAYLDGTVKFCNYQFLTQGPLTSPPTSTTPGSTLDNMWADFDMN